MKVLLRKIPVSNISKGMYVSKLDRPWLETPFLYQGFSITSDKEISILREYCDYVHIDEWITSQNPITKSSSHSNSEANNTKIIKTKTIDELLPRRQIDRYKDTTSTRAELKIARKIVEDIEVATKEIFIVQGASKDINVVHLKQSIEPMVNSVIRNPDAMIWMANLKNCDNYSYRHSISSSIWSVSLGRQLGLPKSDLRLLALGSLLCDIGKSEIPAEILNKADNLTAREYLVAKQHVVHSLALLRETNGINETVIDIVANHHERHAGHGYPNRLKGDDIPILSRIAAIADCYDAITSNRVYADACSPTIAIKKLYDWRNYDFQAELVEEFIQAIGIYPVGSLVTLNTGEVCVVIAEGRQRRLQPTVLLILDADKRPINTMRVINLQSASAVKGSAQVHIDGSLELGAYGIDPEEYYL